MYDPAVEGPVKDCYDGVMRGDSPTDRCTTADLEDLQSAGPALASTAGGDDGSPSTPGSGTLKGVDAATAR
jgi:hypothetical protein